MSCPSPRRWIISTSLALTALLTPLSVHCQEPPEPPQIIETDWQELPEQRSAFAKVYINEEGNETFELGPGPLHYQEPGSSEWLDIDTALSWDEGWVNSTNSFPVHLPSSLGSGEEFRFGPELGISWKPGTLGARLTSGTIVELAWPQATDGYQPDEQEGSILYPDFYPGIDLRATVVAGEIFFETVIKAWDFDFLEEEIDRLFVDTALLVAPELLEQVNERLGSGESIDEVPIYFGRHDDEYSIAIVRDPGIDAEVIEAAYSAVVRNEEDPPSAEAQAIAADWVSPLEPWLINHQLRAWVTRPSLEGFVGPGPVGTSTSALTISFKIRARDQVARNRFWSTTSVPPGTKRDRTTRSIESRCTDVAGTPTRSCKATKTHYGKILSGRKSNGHYRASVAFHGLESLLPSLQAKGVGKIWLGYNSTTAKKPAGVTGFSPKWVVAANACKVLDPSLPPLPPTGYPQSHPDPDSCSYNSTEAHNPGDGAWGGASWTVGTPWEPKVWNRSIGSSNYRFGELWGRGSNYIYQHSTPTADRHGLDNRARAKIYFAIRDKEAASFPLRNPYDEMLCTDCTQDQTLPASVRGSSGRLDVGMELTDVRLAVEVLTRINEADVSITTVGGGPDVIYPAGTLEFDITLNSLGGTATDVWIQDLGPSVSRHGMSGAFYRGGQLVTGLPLLSLANPTIRYRLTSQRAVPQWYNHPRFGAEFAFRFDTQPVYGSVSNTGSRTFSGGSGRLRIPFTPKPPEGVVTVIKPTSTPQTDTSKNYATLASYSLSNPKGAIYASLKAEALPGSPMTVLKEGVHWHTNWLRATDGVQDFSAFPANMKPGLYKIKITPCLTPDGRTGHGPLYCLDNEAWTQQLNVTAATPSGPLSIEWLDAPSADSPSAAKTLTIHGTNLGGSSSTVSVGSPATRTGSVSGNNDLLSAPLAAIPSNACGPVQVTVTRADGATASKPLNIVKPFRGGAAHVVMEAEAANFDAKQMTLVSDGSASNGAAMTKNVNTASTRGKLIYRFKVPSGSKKWQLYLLAAPDPKGEGSKHFARAVIRDDDATPNVVGNILWTQALSGGYSMQNFFQRGQAPGSSQLDLQPGKTYTMTLSSEPSAGAFPKVDMLVLSAGTLPPLKSEVCR